MPRRPTSITDRVRAVILIVSVVVLLTTATAFAVYEVITFKAEQVRNLSTLAAVVADNSAASLAFDNPVNAAEILAALDAEPDIVAAVLYAQDGTLFAKYPSKISEGLLPSRVEEAGSHFREGALELFAPVKKEKKSIGTLYLRSSLQGLNERLWRSGGIAAAVLTGSVIIAFVLSTLLQRRISAPILGLTDAARAVVNQGDYSVRVPKMTDDELGTLTDAFNRMLAETQTDRTRLAEQARLLDLSADAIFVRDLQNRVTFWNRASETAYGFTREEAMGKPTHDLLRTTFPEPLAQIEEKLFRDGRWAGELIHIRKDGTTIIDSTRCSVVGDANGNPVSILESNTDVTERKQAEDALRVSEERLRLAQQVARIGTFEWNLQTNTSHWSKELESMYGLPPGGSPRTRSGWEELIHPGDQPETIRRVQEALESGAFDAQWRVTWPDGSIHWIAGRGRVYFTENGQPLRLLGVNFDITEQKMFQAELERQVKERTAKLQETVGELEAFSYSVSHDMRSPLRAMQGYAMALLEDFRTRLDPQAIDYLERISRASRRLDSLILDVLAYSRVAKTEIALHEVDVEQLIEDLLPNHPEFQPPRAHIRIQKPLHRVIGHEAYLTQCITNLLGNAVKFVAPGVVPDVLIRSEAFDGRIRLCFVDNGIGIDPAHRERIFQMFGRVYPEKMYAGTGIGLAIVRKAAQRMNGEAGVESELGNGSCFWLILSAVNP